MPSRRLTSRCSSHRQSEEQDSREQSWLHNDLGIGAGWHEAKCAAYGIDILPMNERMNRFEECVEVTRSLLLNEQTDFAGDHFQLSQARCERKAVRRS